MCETCFLDQTRKIYSTALTEKYLSTTQELITRGENVTWFSKSIGPALHLSPCRSANVYSAIPPQATHMHFLNSRVPESLLEYYEANAQVTQPQTTASQGCFSSS